MLARICIFVTCSHARSLNELGHHGHAHQAKNKRDTIEYYGTAPNHHSTHIHHASPIHIVQIDSVGMTNGFPIETARHSIPCFVATILIILMYRTFVLRLCFILFYVVYFNTLCYPRSLTLIVPCSH